MSNYSFQQPPDIPDNSIIDGGNYTQSVPHTKIYEGITGLIFRNCNLVNCDVPPDAIVENCNTKQVGFCSHLHPKMLEHGYISKCSISCQHLTGTDTVTIDGTQVDVNYIYSDKGVA